MKMDLALMAIALDDFRLKAVRRVVCGEYIPEFGNNDVRIDMMVAARTYHTGMVDADNAFYARRGEMLPETRNQFGVFGVH